MTADEIEEIENAIGFKLPDAYRAVALNYPPALAETEAPDFAFFDTPKAVIDANVEVRKNGYFGEMWPDQYVIIGENGCGDYYVITKNATLSSHRIGVVGHRTSATRCFKGFGIRFSLRAIATFRVNGFYFRDCGVVLSHEFMSCPAPNPATRPYPARLVCGRARVLSHRTADARRGRCAPKVPRG